MRAELLMFFCCFKNYIETQSEDMSLLARKPVFGVSDRLRLKPVCSATEAS